jgi:hypothetical protein
MELHSNPASQGRIAEYRAGGDQSAGIGALAKPVPASAMLMPTIFAWPAAPNDRDVFAGSFLKRTTEKSATWKLKAAPSDVLANSRRLSERLHHTV